MSKKRFVVECVWSGYSSSQSRPCHRVVTTQPEKYRSIHTVKFTDNTTMSVTVRPCVPRERVDQFNCYGSLLDEFIDAGQAGFVSVSNLHKDN